MNEYFRTLYAFNHGYCKNLLADIGEEEMLLQPAEGVNSPAWLLGHLALCTDFALGVLGQEKRLSAEWMTNFGPGSSPTPANQPFPEKQPLWDAYATGHEAVEEATRGPIAPEYLSAANPVEFLQPVLPTAGDLLAHLMTTHESSHLGHLSNWRRQMGRAPLF